MIPIDYTEQPLNKVLHDLKERYDLQFSFNDELLNNCIVTDNTTYSTIEKAIESWLQKCDLSYKINNGTFVIFKAKKSSNESEENKKPPIIQCQIIDKFSNEPLPFSSVQINNTGIITDVNGNFSFKSNEKKINVRISHLGYFTTDTILPAKAILSIKLKPKIIGLEEVLIRPDLNETLPYIQTQSGFQKINHSIAAFIPGNNGNTLFNVLRLQPGILAAGEQNEDFIIWGSYKGETQIVFDGITLFNTSALNDNIGVVNPLIVKDIEIHKGGYNVLWGDRVGGFVNITSKSGNSQKFISFFSINNETASGLLNIPVSKRSSLQCAFRKTYYNQFKLTDTDISEESKDYNFEDLNIKYSGKTKNGDNYFISMLGSNDSYLEGFDKLQDSSQYYSYTEIEKQQRGIGFSYSKNWKNGSSTNLTASRSILQNNTSNISKLIDSKQMNDSSNYNSTLNNIDESAIKLQHHLPSTSKHNIVFGGGFIENGSDFYQDSIESILKSSREKLSRINGYVIDKIQLNKAISIESGLRVDIPLNSYKPLFQPRISAQIQPKKNVIFNIRLGLYNQFISENAIVDNFNNYLYYWSIMDKEYSSTLKGKHAVAGASFNIKGIAFRIESYFKKTDGLTRWISNNENYIIGIGESRSYGMDLFTQKRIGRHNIWLAYTLSKTEEYFSYFQTNSFQLAPQDQRHEVKTAGLFNFSPFFFTLDYVYGSGIQNTYFEEPANHRTIYSRLDAALLYKFKTKKFKLEAGFSILNILNRANVRYNNFSNFPDNKSIYSSATPFTPLVFINFGF